MTMWRALMLSIAIVLACLSGAQAQMSLSINIAPPPPIRFSGPPDVVVVPSGNSYVYMVPNRTGMYFFDGYWWRFYDGYWFRSDIYNGPWEYVDYYAVPQMVVAVPPDYPRYLPAGYHRIQYYDLHRNWRSWDSGQYWHRHDWYRHEMRDEIRRDRYVRYERAHGSAWEPQRYVQERG